MNEIGIQRVLDHYGLGKIQEQKKSTSTRAYVLTPRGTFCIMVYSSNSTPELEQIEQERKLLKSSGHIGLLYYLQDRKSGMFVNTKLHFKENWYRVFRLLDTIDRNSLEAHVRSYLEQQRQASGERFPAYSYLETLKGLINLALGAKNATELNMVASALNLPPDLGTTDAKLYELSVDLMRYIDLRVGGHVQEADILLRDITQSILHYDQERVRLLARED